MQKLYFNRSILSFIASVLVLGLGINNPVLAQGTTGKSKKDDKQLEEVTVTGSRIVRRDFQSNSPILTVDQELLEKTYTSSIESNLNKLPQFTPDKTADQGGDIQPTATNTPGSATISLRNLGANRSLVLIDGRRATPGNASMVVDVNTIPAFAIDRVEVITGGASATYGADAVGGVTNFIMKKNFEGMQIGSQVGVTEHGDALEWNVSGMLGTSFADGRGNILLSMSENRRQDAFRRDRSWWRDFAKSPDTAGTEYFPDFSAVNFDPVAGVPNLPTQAAVDSIFGAANAVSTGDRYYVNPDGTLFTGMFQSFSRGGVSRFEGDLSGYKWGQTSDGLLKQNFTNELLTLPLERYNLFSRGNFKINDWLSVFAQGMFSKVSVHTIQQPSPSVNGWAAYIPNDGRVVPAEVQTLLDNRPDPTAPYRLTYYLDYADRTDDLDVFTYNFLAGFQGEIPGTDWTWELYASQGESETSAFQSGFASLNRFRAVISAPNWGQGFTAQGNPLFGGFGASSATCTSGINPFDLSQQISKDCIEAISADIKARSVMDQTVYEFNSQGGLFDLPAGQVRGAVGATRRENKYKFTNDTLTTQGREFLDQAIGLYPSGNSTGGIDINEVYGELLVPVLSDTFVDKVELELGARYSDYSTTGSSLTYKLLSDVTINSHYRLRGGFNRAERAPNIAELYLAPQQTFVFSAGGDPCSLNSNLSYSANPVTDPANAAAVKALCSQLMEKSAPGTSTNFYQNAGFQTAGGTFAFPTLQGNPNVEPEQADTWTVGLVMDAPFEGTALDNDALNSLRLAIDYYNIKVKNAIGPQSIDTAQQQCFSTEYNPTLSISSPYCAGINRVANDGAIGNIITTYYNNGRFQTSGIDFQLDWGMDIGPGHFSINSVTNYLIELKSADLPGNPALDYAGSLGPNQNGLNPGSYQWKMFNTFSYGWDIWNFSVQWRHLPSIASASKPLVPTTANQGAGSYDLFSLNGSVSLGESILGGNVDIRFGVDNLFDKDPPLLEVNSAPPPGTLAGGGFSTSAGSYMYDLQGRRFYLGANFTF